MDGTCDIFWIKSINGTFIALQIKSFGPKKFKIQAGVKKCHFVNFLEGRDGRALLVRPSRIPCWIS
jgi:hypothetical protein